jgi:hypothetical protein
MGGDRSTTAPPTKSGGRASDPETKLEAGSAGGETALRIEWRSVALVVANVVGEVVG